MRKVVAYTLVSVDGVAESPEKFLFQFDEVMEANLGEVIGTQSTVLLGRRMYDEWSVYWPTSDVQPFADFIKCAEVRRDRDTVGDHVDKRRGRRGSGRGLRARVAGG